jgi:hypothetical protein
VTHWETTDWDRKHYREALQWCRQNNVRVEFNRGRVKVLDRNGDGIESGKNLVHTVRKIKKNPEKYNI